MCRTSLIGITRSARSKKKLPRDGSTVCIYNVVLRSQLPQITDVQGLSVSFISNMSLELFVDSFNYYNVFLQVRFYSNPARRPSFISQFIENIKQEIQKNKEMKESLKKFREEAEKLEQSEALRSARQKFQAVESEATKGSEALKEKLESLKEKVQVKSNVLIKLISTVDIN